MDPLLKKVTLKKTKRERLQQKRSEDGTRADTPHLSPELGGSPQQPALQADVSSLEPRQLVSPAGGAPALGDVMNKFEVLGIVGEGEWINSACIGAYVRNMIACSSVVPVMRDGAQFGCVRWFVLCGVAAFCQHAPFPGH